MIRRAASAMALALGLLVPAARPMGRPADTGGVQAGQAARAHLSIWYDRPAHHFTESLPLGNGRIGAMVFGGVRDDRIVLNEQSLWSGSVQDPDRQDASRRLPEIRQLLLDGRNRDAQDLVMQSFTCEGPGSGRGEGAAVQYGAYQTLGALTLTYIGALPGSVIDGYRRELDLTDAVATVTYRQDGLLVTRESFVSAPAQALVMQVRGSRPRRISVDLSLDRPEQFETVPDGTSGLLMTGQLDNGVDGRGMRYAARVRVSAQDGRVSVADGRLEVRDASTVTIWLAAATDFQGFAGRRTADPVAATLADMQGATAQSFAALKRAHILDHQQWFGRVDFRLGTDAATARAALEPTDRRLAAVRGGADDPALAALYFQYGRYLLVSSSRPGGLPANLQGLWAEEIQTPWNGDYHLNINVQMNYWPAEVTNLSELHEPLFALIASLQEPGRRTARRYYDAGGWVAHVITNVWGFTAPGEQASWGSTVSGSGWLVSHLWQHYAYTMDRAFLERVYPIMKGSAEFYLDMLIEEPAHGWLVTAPSNSPENRFRLPGGEIAQTCMGPTIDMQILRELFAGTARAAGILGVDGDFRLRLLTARGRLAPNQIGGDGRLQEWLEAYDEPEPHHRHVSHLYGLYPYYELTPDASPALAAAARASLERRGDAGTGWSLAWKIAFWARLGDGDRAGKLLRDLLKPTRAAGFAYEGTGAGTYPNLFCAHPPFQIDGNLGATAAIAEMLMQSHPDSTAADDGVPVIRLLPALPAMWPDGRVAGLRGRGDVTVDIEWKAGTLVRARLLAGRDGAVPVRYRGVTRRFSLHAGRPLVVGPAEFRAAAGVE